MALSHRILPTQTSIIQTGVLYVVATPIGHLQDITYRAIEVLKSVRVILAEDTRVSSVLLKHYHIHTPCQSMHAWNESDRIDWVIHQCQDGHSLALIADAGTPLISDPGAYLIQHVRQSRIQIIPIPGPCAAIAALSVCSFNTHGFCFEGFLSTSSKALDEDLRRIHERTAPTVFYESPRRILKTLMRAAEIMGHERKIMLAKEITKYHEFVHEYTIGEALQYLQEDHYASKGEYVVIVQGCIEKPKLNIEHIKETARLLVPLKLKDAVSILMTTYPIDRNQAYRINLDVRISNPSFV